MTGRPRAKRILAGLAALCALVLPARGARAQDDTVLFSTNVAPNVLLLLDNSGSMNEIVWHPAFDPTATYSCSYYAPDTIGESINNNTTLTRCGITRTLYHDNRTGFNTRYRGNYLNWLFSPASNAAYAEIQQGNNGFPSSCVGGASFAKYQRSRMTAAKQAIQDIVCEVNLVRDVRFGLAIFRSPGSGSGSDSNGGFVIEPVDFYNSGQAADFDAALQSIDPDAWTPLSESLFQLYTYFMSRTATDRPFGKDGVTRFPMYSYRASSSGVGGEYTTNQYPDSPVQYACQKSFVIIITDGEPTRDDFDLTNPTNTTTGYSDFVARLIGDWNPDGEVEEQDDLVCTDCESSFYLDDIALFMRQRDFRPDMTGDQLIDTYTVGFTTGPIANSLLQRTAQNGNGLFFQSNNAEELSQAIIDAFIDIIEKSQSFTAATVPATRTASGEKLYVSLFVPSGRTPYWEGHLRSYEITGAGEIHDANGNCALNDPNPGECFQGPFKPDAVHFWDAGEEITDPSARELLTSKVVGVTPTMVPFDTSLTALDLGVVFPPSVTYPFSTALGAEGLTDEIVQNVRGCEMGTGVLDPLLVLTPQDCTNRYWLLGDIFHSNPVVIGNPALFDSDPSYVQFAQNLDGRTRMIYAGTNDGWIHGFVAGNWDPGATPPGYDDGTGFEAFGFMPWSVREVIRNVPTDTGGRDYYGVDGSPTAADVWLYTSPTTAAKLANGSEWKTVIVGGLRQGGGSYYALDVSDPGGAGYPGYLWEFPRENSPASVKALMGQTWGDPIVTKIRVKVGGNDNGGEGFERWVAIVTGGYHPTGDPNNPATYDPVYTAGRAIAILDMKTGRPLAVKAFDAGAAASDPQSQMRYAIASTPAVYDLDFDGFADVIFVGDLGGNVWKWVIHEIGEDRANDGSGLLTQPAWVFRKFFDAPEWTQGSNPTHYKSFFFPPAGTLRSGTLWLAFGSGERANVQFQGTTNTGDNNRFYAMTDLDPFEVAAPAYATLLESNLLNVTSNDNCANLTSYRGYYIVGVDAEKWVTNVDLFLHYVFAASFIPSATLDPCTIGGQATLYVFKIYCGEGFFDSGGNPDRTYDLGAGLPTDPRITVGTEGDGSNRVIINKQGGEILSLVSPPGFKIFGLYYWRELTQ
jgi:type IV pilus assembly protein PilY1